MLALQTFFLCVSCLKGLAPYHYFGSASTPAIRGRPRWPKLVEPLLEDGAGYRRLAGLIAGKGVVPRLFQQCVDTMDMTWLHFCMQAMPRSVKCNTWTNWKWALHVFVVADLYESLSHIRCCHQDGMVWTCYLYEPLGECGIVAAWSPHAGFLGVRRWLRSQQLAAWPLLRLWVEGACCLGSKGSNDFNELNLARSLPKRLANKGSSHQVLFLTSPERS